MKNPHHDNTLPGLLYDLESRSEFLFEVTVQIPKPAQDVDLLRSFSVVIIIVNNLYEEIAYHEDVQFATVLDAGAEGNALGVQVTDLLTQ
jgi:hypothetical protein